VRDGRSSVRELAADVLAGEEAWVVGGAVRDELLGRPLLDLDVACREPQRAARRYARRSGGAPFPLSDRWGAWRVALDDGRTVDFTPLRNGIEADLATRDFTVNAIAVPLAGGEPVDPHEGLLDLERRLLRAVGDSVFEDDPLRLLRAARLEDELGFRLDPGTEDLVREHATLVDRPAGERILAELERLSPDGYRRLDELGLLALLGGSLDLLDRAETSQTRLVAVFGHELNRLPVSNDLRRLGATLLRAKPPPDDSPRAIHRFRRATEPWSVEALRFLGAPDLVPAVERARAQDPSEPLLRGDELGLPPGPEIGRLLALVEEERAAGTISTREEALELVRREGANPD
jgi:Poly A polymerase head domain